jgi:hypothetical protein
MNKMILRVKSRLNSKELILNGSLTKQYKQCGKLNCRCNENQKLWHGPYLIWTRKVKGKTVTKTLNRNQAIAVKKAIREMKQLNLIVERWKVLSLKEIEKI